MDNYVWRGSVGAVMKKYLNLAISGKVEPKDIGHFVRRWHRAFDLDESLHSYLGLSKEEYCRWVEDPNTINEIVNSHR